MILQLRGEKVLYTSYTLADKHVSQVLLDMAIHIVEDNSDD